MARCSSVKLLATSVLVGALVFALPARAQSRGELLYSTHCIACHTAQAHWRDQRLATNWSGLKAEVRRWQAAAMLPWSEEDVVEVTRYLNDTFYRYPQTSDAVSSPAPALHSPARIGAHPPAIPSGRP